jgi:hypothetical protein
MGRVERREVREARRMRRPRGAKKVALHWSI